MQKDSKDLKKFAFEELRSAGYPYSEIKKMLNVAERTLYYWAAESNDIEDSKEIEITSKTNEILQNLQKENDEMKERIDDLSRHYTNLWRELHTQKEPTPQEKANVIQLEMMLERSFKNDKILEMGRQRAKEIFEIHRMIEQKPLWDNTEDDLRWQRLMDKYDEKMDRLHMHSQRLKGYQKS